MPREQAGRLWAHQLPLTIAGAVDEAHDTHHPIASGRYCKEQQAEARRCAVDFVTTRVPQYLACVGRHPYGDRHLVGRRVSYCDLSSFQSVAGLHYAFPRAMAQLEPGFGRVIGLHDRVA